MPSTDTITSTDLTDFVPGTRIKSLQVDNNFNIWRGHLLPVDPTVSAADTTRAYDVGSNTHRYRKVYASPAPYIVSTTGSMSITSSHEVCLFNTTSATATANMPTCVGFYGILTVKNIGTGGKTLFLDGAGTEVLDNTLTANLVDNEAQSYISDQTKWWSI